MMAERQRITGKKKPAVKPAAVGKPGLAPKSDPTKASDLPKAAATNTETPGSLATPPPDPSARIRALEAERDKLAAELEAAKARIAALEQAREQVLNRIDWVIDSLHSLSSE